MNNKAKGSDYSKATPDLVRRVKEVVNDAGRRRYSASKVYGTYNEAFGLNETAQTCSTCLANRARALSDWLAGYNEWAARQVLPHTDPDVDSELDAVPLGAEPVPESEAPATEPKPVPAPKTRKPRNAVPAVEPESDLT